MIRQNLLNFLSKLFILWAYIKINTIPILKVFFSVLVINTPRLWTFYHKSITNQSHLEILIDIDLPYKKFKKLYGRGIIAGPNYRINLIDDTIINVQTGEKSSIKFDSIKTTILG